jgi:hypothetical protein
LDWRYAEGSSIFTGDGSKPKAPARGWEHA